MIPLFSDLFHSEEDKLQAKGRFVRASELPLEEQEKLRASTVSPIVSGRIDDRIGETLTRKRDAALKLLDPKRRTYSSNS